MKNSGYRIPRQYLIAFAKAAIEDLGLSNQDVMRYLQGGKKKCSDCGERHLYIDRFCPECGTLAYNGEDTKSSQVSKHNQKTLLEGSK